MSIKQDEVCKLALLSALAANEALEAHRETRKPGTGLYARPELGEKVTKTETAMVAASKASTETMSRLTQEQSGKVMQQIQAHYRNAKKER